MVRGRRVLLAAAVAAALIAGFLATSGPPAPTPNPPGTFSFAVLADAPYYVWEDLQYRLVLRALAEHDLSGMIQAGDMFWRPCTDELYRRSRRWFDGLPHPVIYTPGDNEWSDCWEPGSGGFPPLTGSPDVGWVRVVVTPGDPPRFAFEEHVVPEWKYW